MNHILDGIDAILFDLDGTLVETNIDFPLMKREMLALAERYGVDSAPAKSMDILAVIDYVEEALGAQPERARAARKEAFGVLRRIELVHSKDAREIAFARELIRRLQSVGVKIGIVTRNCRKASQESLEVCGFHGDILMLSREDVRNTKPHPEHLLHALERLGATPEKSIMVGDHTMDVEAGRSAGMRTIGLLSPERPRDFFEKVKPDAVVESLREIADALIDFDS